MSISDYTKYLIDRYESLHVDFDKMVSEFMNCIARGNSIWIMGNGGSAGTAEHFETDLSYVKAGSLVPKIKVSALTSNTSLITAIGNDIGFENIFSHQLERKSIPGDLCVVISASGNSENLIHAVNFAKEHGLFSIGLLGFDGGKLETLVNLAAVVRTEIGRYGPVEDIHLAICHELSSRILNELLMKGFKK
jgi:D-sedoheptulose 7-phosphate isomerase